MFDVAVIVIILFSCLIFVQYLIASIVYLVLVQPMPHCEFLLVTIIAA